MYDFFFLSHSCMGDFFFLSHLCMDDFLFFFSYLCMDDFFFFLLIDISNFNMLTKKKKKKQLLPHFFQLCCCCFVLGMSIFLNVLLANDFLFFLFLLIDTSCLLLQKLHLLTLRFAEIINSLVSRVWSVTLTLVWEAAPVPLKGFCGESRKAWRSS